MRVFDFILVTLITGFLAFVIVVFRNDAFPYPAAGPAVAIEPARPRPWAGLMIHSSGTDRGSLASLEKAHASHGGAPFHFVIGNGSETADGAVEQSGRWKEDRPGRNPDWIEICVVGDLDRHRMTKRQELALNELALRLCGEKMIPGTEIYGESEKRPGVSCPGRCYDPQRTRQFVRGALGK